MAHTSTMSGNDTARMAKGKSDLFTIFSTRATRGMHLKRAIKLKLSFDFRKYLFSICIIANVKDNVQRQGDNKSKRHRGGELLVPEIYLPGLISGVALN